MKNKKILLCSLIISMFLGCQSYKVQPLDTSNTLPKAFTDTTASKQDTFSSANITWKEYYKDQKLIALIDTALTNNYDFKRAMQRIGAVQSDVLLSKNSLFPRVDVGIQSSLRKFGLYTMDGSGNATTEITPGRIVPVHLPDYFVGFQTSWEIDVWGKLKNRKKAALSKFFASVEGKNLVITTLISNVADRYYELLALDQTLVNIDSTIALQENILKVIQYQKDANRATDLGVKQFEALLLNLKAFRIDIKQEIIDVENQLNLLLGRYPQKIDRNTFDVSTDLPFAISIGKPADLVKNRADIRMAEFDLRASHADLKAAKAAFYPSFNINGQVGFQAFLPRLLFTTPESFVYGIFANLATPLVNRAAIKADFKRANAYQLDALFNYQQVILNSFTEVSTLVSKINNLDRFVQLKSKEVQTLNTSISIANDLFSSGRADYIDLLLTQQSALQSSLALIDARKRQYQTSIYLYKALGGG
jgi:multidrug efflux system outer membrane protein